jgi:hypothetical protein
MGKEESTRRYWTAGNAIEHGGKRNELPCVCCMVG